MQDEFETGLKFVPFRLFTWNWNRANSGPFCSSVYTVVRPGIGSQIHPVSWFSCKHKAEDGEF
jgi:hypothetical protein